VCGLAAYLAGGWIGRAPIGDFVVTGFCTTATGLATARAGFAGGA